MFGILVSAGVRLLSFLLSSFIIKFVLFFALMFIVQGFFGLVAHMIPNSYRISIVLGGIPASVWYFLDLFNIAAGFTAITSAYATRFVIRRLPVIG
ncbi:hypothetical protein RCH14_001643 [Massilia sp. MP_M2]|uniref:DUF2523 family protein n=1 Tax=Massilia sp. MP_M2 TaxID=3071713 RepID=UPI00319E90F9